MDGTVREGDLKRVQELIRSGADVNEPCRVGAGVGSLLILAITEGYEDIALALLEAGADVHAKDKGGWTALHWACGKIFAELVQALIDRGSRVNEGDSLGRTPLMLACEWGREAIAMRLLRAGVSCEGLSGEHVNGLFRHACQEHDLPVVKILLNKGCSVSILVTKEQEQLRHACREGDVFVALTLLKNGCSVSILSTEEQGQLLHHACNEGDAFVARALLKNDCSVKKLTPADVLYLVHNLSQQEKEELLHLASCQGHVFTVHTLLKNGCSVSILSRNVKENLLPHAC